MATTTEKYALGSQATLLSTGLNSLANNALALSSAFNNVEGGGGGDGYTLCDLELLVTFPVAPTANTAVVVWLLGSQDGTNYEDGDASTTPARLPDAVFPVRAVTSAQRIIRRIWLPWGLMKALLKSDGTGQSFASSGNTLSIRPVTRTMS
jgi:hypothetical protein